MGYKIKRILVGTQQVRPSVPATAITLNKSSISLTTVGQTSQLTATLTPADSTSTVSWSSSNTSIATVSSSGLVTCVTPGSCTITATTDNGLTASCSVSGIPVPTSGLLGYRPLQSDLKDASGNGKDGSWYSGTGTFSTVGGKTGAAVIRNSSTEYSSQHIVTTLNYSGPTMTICGWVYYNLFTYNVGYRPGVMTNSSSSSNYIALSPRPTQSNRLTVGGNGNLLTSTTTPSTGTWCFVVGVLTSSGKKIYMNGTQIASDSTGFTSGQGSIWRLGCGQHPDSSSNFGGTDGYVRHCAVYNRELTTDEITQFYNQTA